MTARGEVTLLADLEEFARACEDDGKDLREEAKRLRGHIRRIRGEWNAWALALFSGVPTANPLDVLRRINGGPLDVDPNSTTPNQAGEPKP